MTIYQLKQLGYHNLSSKSMSANMISICNKYGITILIAKRADLRAAGIDVQHDSNHAFAAANIEDRIIVLNQDGLNDLGLRLHEAWAVMWHEIGHIVLRTENEQEADLYAIKQLKAELGNESGINAYLGDICKTYIHHMMRRHKEGSQYAFRLKYQKSNYKRFLDEVPALSDCDF